MPTSLPFISGKLAADRRLNLAQETGEFRTLTVYRRSGVLSCPFSSQIPPAGQPIDRSVAEA
jgi:hypothetical protein